MDALRGRIAVIGWGSLIWDLDALAPKVTGEWLMKAGPPLPFEFSLVSKKRKMGLAVCLDPDHGDVCPTHVICSAKQDIHEAAEDLFRRERSPSVDFIGAYCAQTAFLRTRLAPVAEPLYARPSRSKPMFSRFTKRFSCRKVGESFSFRNCQQV